MLPVGTHAARGVLYVSLKGISMNRLATTLRFLTWSILKRNRVSADLHQMRPADKMPPDPLWRNGAFILKWFRGLEHELRVRWEAPNVRLGAALLVLHPNDERQLVLDLGLGLGTICFSYTGKVPSWWPQKRAENRALIATISGTGWLSWTGWLNGDYHSENDPKWRRWSCDLRDLVFGRERILKTERDTHTIGVPTPRGVVPCIVTEARVLIDRPRWPVPRWANHYEVRVAKVEARGGLRDCSMAAADWVDLVGKLVAQAADTRRGWLSFQWTPTAKHCDSCGGAGRTLDEFCKVCRGDGLRPLHELARVAIVEACREKPDDEQTVIEMRMRAFKAVEQLIERAEMSTANAAPAQACTALLSSSVLAIALGRLGVAAEAAGKALGCAVTIEQAGQAQRLLSLVARMQPLRPPRVQVLAQDLPDGQTVAMLNWEPADFIELCSLEDDASAGIAEAWRTMNAYMQDLIQRATAAGWTSGTPLADFVQRLTQERNSMSDRLTMALACLRDLQRMAIPEGPEGGPLRDLSIRATALLSASA